MGEGGDSLYLRERSGCRNETILKMLGSDIPLKPPAALSREERWELRRRQKLGMQSDIRQAPPPFPEPAPLNPVSFPPQQPAFKPPEPSFPPADKGSFPVEKPVDSFPLRAGPDPSIIPQASEQARPPDSFFTNPVSDQEFRRQQAQSEYRRQAMENTPPPPQRRLSPEPPAYVPAPREERVSRSQIPMMDQKRAESEQKRQYQQELMRQMKENEEKKRKKGEDNRDAGEGFFKFGRPGAGAPNRDAMGNVITTRPPKYNENDPRFLNPQRAGYVPPAPQRNTYPEPEARFAPPPYPDMQQGEVGRGRYMEPMPYDRYPPDQPRYSVDPGYADPGRQSQPYPDPGRQSQPYTDPGRMYPDAGRFSGPPQQSYSDAPRPPQGYPEPSRFPPQQGYGMQAPAPYPEPMNYPDPNSRHQPPLPPEYPPGPQSSPPRPSPLVGGENLSRLEADYDSASKARQKGELARMLQEQIEEKKRRQEEEKRQKMLEERLEEAKLEKQRQDMEEEYRRETEKKKKEFRDLQAANEAAIQVAMPKGRPRRQRTPIDLPAAEPPRSPPRDPPGYFPPPTVVETVQRSVPVEAAQHLNSQLENELWRLRNEMVNQNTELRESLQALRQQSLQANQQRFEALKELERVREEMRMRGNEEDSRQRELLMAISKNPIKGPYEPTTRLPAPNPLPLVLPRSNLDDPKNTLGLDYADKSLTAESKFIPVFGADGPSVIPQPPRRRENADISLASLPEFGPSNVPVTGSMAVDTLATAGGGTTIGIEAINRKNEERLLALEKMEGHDEIAKLDALLANYMEVEKRLPPKPSSGKRPSSLASRGKLVVSKAPLGSIPEAEADVSLPSLAGDSGGKFDWRFE